MSASRTSSRPTGRPTSSAAAPSSPARCSTSPPAIPRPCSSRIDELNAKRWASLPSGRPNAGSIFKNPPGDHAGRLIDACGLKGTRAGGAEISLEHANVIVNTGGARAADVLELMQRCRSAVAERFGVELEPEIVLTGPLAAAWRNSVPSRA